jgi:hypothetical protein
MEPKYLASLGEFATLKNAIGSWYHQDTALEFNSDFEIWSDIYSSHDAGGRARLVEQLTKLLRCADREVSELWHSQAHFHGFKEDIDARTYLASMLDFFQSSAH